MRYAGKVGFAPVNTEIRPGIFEDVVIENEYFGDVVRDSRGLEEADKVNFDISVGNSISIVADAYAQDHVFDMRYVEWQGVLWVVSDVEMRPPRLVLRLGGRYNGPTPPAPVAA